MKNQITTMIKGFFAGKAQKERTKILIGAPKFIIRTNKLIVQVPYYSGSVLQDQETEMNALMSVLMTKENTLQKPVELRFIRLQYPYLDSLILSQYLALNAGKYNFLRMKKRLFQKVGTGNVDGLDNHLPSLSTGVKVELSGRLTTQRSIPRKTVTNAHKGSFTVSKKLDASLSLSQYTAKNKFGSYTLKV
jgi:ribosomal protein S3